MKLLFVEDEENFAKPLKRSLERYGYAVEWVVDGKEGMECGLVNSYDCIILDINLPTMNGLQICRKLREEQVLSPILMLTASATQVDKISGFMDGADDYVVKPCSLQELLLRVQALIRRSGLNKQVILEGGGLQYYPEAKKTMRGDQEINLTLKESLILEYLLRNKGKVISGDELFEHVWGEESEMINHTVKTHIKTIRKKIDPEKSIIKTKKGAGYVIE